MECLSSSDLETLLAVLREIRSIRDLTSFPARALTALGRLVPADLIAYNEINPEYRRVVGQAIPPEPVPPDAAEILARHLDEHPMISYYRQSRNGRALKISDFLGQRQFHRLGLYHELYGPLGVEDQLAFALPMPAPLVVGIAFNRRKRSFTERERLLLDLARPYLAQTYQTAELLGRVVKAFDLVNRGLILLTTSGQCQFVSPRAERWLADYFGPTAELAGALPAALRDWVQRQQAHLDQTDDVPPPAVPLVVERDGGQLTIRFIPPDEFGDVATLLLEERITRPSVTHLVALGLTRREIDVLQLVARGHSDAEIAGILVLHPRTVKKHLEHIYRKLDVTSRTAAIARAFLTQ